MVLLTKGDCTTEALGPPRLCPWPGPGPTERLVAGQTGRPDWSTTDATGKRHRRWSEV